MPCRDRGSSRARRSRLRSTSRAPARLNVLAAHLGLSPKGRRHQSARLAEIAGSWDGPGLVLGDFNEWRLGAVHRILSARMPGHAVPRSWPSLMPLARMDRIYHTPGMTLDSVFLDAQAGGASDHLPLVADLTLR